MTSIESRQHARRQQFKKTVDPEDARRQREDQAIQLRKQKKEENLHKRRFIDPQSTTPPVMGLLGDSPGPSTYNAMPLMEIQQQVDMTPQTANDFAEGTRLLYSEKHDEQLLE